MKDKQQERYGILTFFVPPMMKPMKCTTDWEVYDPTASVMCSVCIEEYSGYSNGYGSNGYSQMGYTSSTSGYGFNNNNSYSNGYINMGYNGSEGSGRWRKICCLSLDFRYVIVQFPSNSGWTCIQMGGLNSIVVLAKGFTLVEGPKLGKLYKICWKFWD